MPRRILILESRTGSLAGVAELLASETPEACEVQRATDVEAALLHDEAPDLLFVDAEGRADDGVGVLAQLHRMHPELPLVLVSPRGDVDLARRAVDAGAIDLLVRGERLPDRVATQLRKLKRITRLRKRVDVLERDREVHAAVAAERYRIVGGASNLRDLVSRVERVAPVPRPVLILGERGTGKELVARALHDASGRTGPFVVVNSAALADDLLEAELFGHERGAYTGADRRVRGRFELAHQGTLFLDEIGHMSGAFQRKLLRVLEDGRFARVGGEQEICVDTRVVAATNIDLDAQVKSGAFLPDLYDRLAFEVLHLPPLRDRVEDIRMLADHFLARFLREVPGYAGRHFDEDAYRLLESYDYPGNVRELRYVVERAAYRSLDDVLRPEDIGELSPAALTPHAPGSFKRRLEAFERQMIAEAMAEADGNQAAAARLLGLSYHQLRYYATKHK